MKQLQKSTSSSLQHRQQTIQQKFENSLHILQQCFEIISNTQFKNQINLLKLKKSNATEQQKTQQKLEQVCVDDYIFTISSINSAMESLASIQRQINKLLQNDLNIDGTDKHLQQHYIYIISKQANQELYYEKEQNGSLKYEIQQLNSQIIKLKQQNQQLKEQLDNQQNIDKMEKGNYSNQIMNIKQYYKDQLQQAQYDLMQQKNEVGRFTDEMNQLQISIKNKDQSIENLQYNNQLLTSENKQLQEKIQQLYNQQNHELIKEKEHYINELNKVNIALQEHRTKVCDLNNMVKRLQAEKDFMQHELKKVQQKITKNEQYIDQLKIQHQNDLQRTRVEFENKYEEMKLRDDSKERLMEQIKQLQTQVDNLMIENNNCKEEFRNNKMVLDDFMHRNKQILYQNEELERECHDLRETLKLQNNPTKKSEYDSRIQQLQDQLIKIKAEREPNQQQVFERPLSTSPGYSQLRINSAQSQVQLLGNFFNVQNQQRLIFSANYDNKRRKAVKNQINRTQLQKIFSDVVVK